MASRHRVRAPCMQIIKTATVPAAACKRVNIKQFHDSKIKFPLMRRMARCGPAGHRCCAAVLCGKPWRLPVSCRHCAFILEQYAVLVTLCLLRVCL